MKPFPTVAIRCLALEVLFQRYQLEIDDDEVAEREKARTAWSKRITDLGVVLDEEESRLLGAPIGSLSEEDLDELYGRASASAVLIWALNRSPSRPTSKSLEEMTEHGLLGDGSIKKAKASAETVTLRSAKELEEAYAEYTRIRGKAKEVEDPERVFADIAADQLAWILE